MSNGKEPAFPMQREHEGSDGKYVYSSNGMTLRQYYAAKAMQGDWAAQSNETGQFTNDATEEALSPRAKLYLLMADTLLNAESNK